MRTALAAVAALTVTAGTATARPLRSGHDRVGALPGGGFVVLTDLCDEAPSCRPNRVQVFDAQGEVVADVSRLGVAGVPLARALAPRMQRLYDATLRALAATAVEPEPATTDDMGVTRFARLHWTHAVEHDATGAQRAHLRRADGTAVTSFEVQTWYELEQLVQVGDQCVLISYTNFELDLSGQAVRVFPCS